MKSKKRFDMIPLIKNIFSVHLPTPVSSFQIINLLHVFVVLYKFLGNKLYL